MIYYIFAGDDYYPQSRAEDKKKGFEAASDEEAKKVFEEWQDEGVSEQFPNDRENWKTYDWYCLLKADLELTMIAY